MDQQAGVIHGRQREWPVAQISSEKSRSQRRRQGRMVEGDFLPFQSKKHGQYADMGSTRGDSVATSKGGTWKDSCA